jgi:endoglucanase
MDGPDPDWTMASWSNGNPFNCTWQPDNISFDNGIMTITLDNAGCPSACDGRPYASGEYRTRDERSPIGYYEARMRGAAGDGQMSASFFTYTGGHDPNPNTLIDESWDEIDFEILGRDCSQVQTNYYVGGRGGHEQMIPLGFNGCEEFGNYGFMLSENALVFYVNGREVRRVENTALPLRDARIIVNGWLGTGVDAWLGHFAYPDRPITLAEYKWIRFSTLEAREGSPQPVVATPIAPTTPVASGGTNLTAEIASISRGSHPSGDIPVVVTFNISAAPAGTEMVALYFVTNQEWQQGETAWHSGGDYPFNANVWSGHSSIIGRPAGRSVSISTILRALSASGETLGEVRSSFSLDQVR